MAMGEKTLSGLANLEPDHNVVSDANANDSQGADAAPSDARNRGKRAPAPDNGIAFLSLVRQGMDDREAAMRAYNVGPDSAAAMVAKALRNPSIRRQHARARELQAESEAEGRLRQPAALQGVVVSTLVELARRGSPDSVRLGAAKALGEINVVGLYTRPQDKALTAPDAAKDRADSNIAAEIMSKIKALGLDSKPIGQSGTDSPKQSANSGQQDAAGDPPDTDSTVAPWDRDS